MREYEAMFILKPDLNEDSFKAATEEIADIVKKHEGEVLSAEKFSEKKRLAYELRVPATGGYAKHSEGIYYLLRFKIAPSAISKIRGLFKLKENILRVLITV